MLDDRRKYYLQQVNVRSIKPNGVLWIFGNEVRTYQLTKEEIRYLRWYHKDPNIAKDVYIEPPKRRTYQVANDRNKYNRHCRTKGKVKHSGIMTKIIVGSLLVNIVVGSAFVGFTLAKNDINNNHMTVQTVSVDNDNYYSGAGREQVLEVTETEETLPEDMEVNRKRVISYLCNVYQLDYNIVYNKLVEITNNFTSGDYLNGHLNGVTCKGMDVQCDTEDELLMYTIRVMKQDPSRFNLDSSVHINNGYESGDDYYKQISDISEVLGVDRNLMYAIVNAETSFDSELFNESNNPAGLRNDGAWWSFDTKEEGFIELGMELLKYYRMIKVDPSNVDSITVEKIGNIHAPLCDGNEYWLGNVLDGLEYAQNNEQALFGGEEVKGLGR